MEEHKREEWMTELPEIKGVNLGLGPRKFRTRAGPDFSDRSDWTDTPADRDRKKRERAIGIKPERQQEEPVPEKFSRKKEKSLLEIHQKKLHKKKKVGKF